MRKIKCVLLVDDDEDCHFFHQRLLTKMNCTEKIALANDGKEAINYIHDAIAGNNTLPELIFLDINMPGMNGWDFLDEFEKLDESVKNKIIIIILTTSIHPADKNKSLEYKTVSDFQLKFLSVTTLDGIVSRYFGENTNFPLQ